LQNQTPVNYYVWSKCYLMSAMGYEKYAEEDYFHLPSKEWVTDDFKSSVDQIIKGLDISSDPIEITDTVTLHYFFIPFIIKLI
ncbi:MAG: hypothetical protein ACOCUL_03765, partial [Bacteroidota bacterium]